MTDPMEPAKKLMDAFAKEVEPLGLHLHTFALLPNPDGPPHMVQVMMTFDDADLAGAIGAQPGEPDDANLSVDEKDAFEMLARDFERSSEEEKAAEAAEGLRRMQQELEKGKGILGDD